VDQRPGAVHLDLTTWRHRWPIDVLVIGAGVAGAVGAKRCAGPGRLSFASDGEAGL